jgi:hypothetical protein
MSIQEQILVAAIEKISHEQAISFALSEIKDEVVVDLNNV